MVMTPKPSLNVAHSKIIITLKSLLLKYRLLTSVVFHFEHRFLVDVETTNVNIINVNISFQKMMLTYSTRHRFLQKPMSYSKK